MNCNYIWVLVFLVCFYFGLHSFLADSRVKSVLIKNIVPKKYYRIIYNFLSILLLFPIIWIYLLISPAVLFENQYLSNLGLWLIFIGFVLLAISLRQYNLSVFSGLEQLSNKSSSVSAQLNTSGLNKIVRHPLYTSSLILLWAWFLYHPTDAVLTLVLITTIYVYFGTKLEERKLVREFGADYLAYQKEVSMLIPFL